MKKRNKFIMAVLVLMVFPILVFADMGSPEITSYEVRVTSVAGTNLVDWEGKILTSIPYDTTLKITMEEEREGILYGGTEINKKWGYVKLSDTTLINKEVDLSQFQKEKPQKRYVFADGAYLYKGPSTIYGKVEGEIMIPKGETITYEYSDDCWAYVEYNGVKGWVYIYTYKGFGPLNITSSLSFIVEKEKNKILTLEEIELVNNPIEEKKTGTKIPANKEIVFDSYYYANPKQTYYHIKEGNIEGWIETKTLDNGKEIISIPNVCNSLLTTSVVPLYKTYFDENSKSKIEIPFGTELKILFEAYGSEGRSSWYYVSYQNHKGWIKDDSYINSNKEYMNINYGSIANYLVMKDTYMYTSLDKKDKIEIKKDKKIQSYYSYTDENKTEWLYIREGDKSGWVEENADVKFENRIDACIDVIAQGEIDPVEEKEKEDRKEKEENKPEKEEKLSSKTILFLSIGGAIAVAITALTTILIIQKTKKKKQNKETL